MLVCTNYKRLLLPALAALLFPIITLASVRNLKISEAVTSKLIKLSAVNTAGSFTGKSVNLSMSTIKKEKDSLYLIVDIGMILKPSDSSYQPMVLAGGDTVLVEPGKIGEIDVAVFCGNSPLHAPATNLRYSYWKVGSDTLVRILKFINQMELYDYLGQHAVWVVTNDHAVSGVYDPERAIVSKQLIDVVCAATSKPHPDYYTLTAKNTTPGTAAYIPKTTGIVAEFDIRLLNASVLSVGIFDVDRNPLETPIDRKLYGPGPHKITVTFEPEPYGPGNYLIRLSNPEKVLREKKVRAEK